MSINYNETMVNDYIIGNDILEYELEELENDALFMSDVLIKSNDIKLYDFASDEVKKDYTFVKNVIEAFKDNEDFIIKVANYYLENADVIEDTDVTKFELYILLSKYIKTKSKKMPFGLVSMATYQALLVDVAAYNNEAKKDKSMVDIGLGFMYLKSKYSYCPIILDYLAENMVNDLFYDENDRLEEKLHSIVRNKESITKDGINNFIVNYVLVYDQLLGNYIAARLAELPAFLETLKKDIKLVLNRWDYYERNNFERKIDIIWQEALKKFETYKTNYNFSQFLDTVIINLGLKETYEKYSEDKIIMPITEELTSIADISFMKYLEELVSKEFSTNIIDEDASDYDIKKAQVISFGKK